MYAVHSQKSYASDMKQGCQVHIDKIVSVHKIHFGEV